MKGKNKIPIITPYSENLKQKMLIVNEQNASRFGDASQNCLSTQFQLTYNFYKQMISTSDTPEPNSVHVLSQVFQASNLILATHNFLSHPSFSVLLPDVHTVYLDDSQCLLEPQVLLAMQSNPYQVVMLGTIEELPRA